MLDAWLRHHAETALVLTLWLSLPAVLAATVVGLLVGLFQALTQIQDQTLPHALKLVAVILVLIATLPWLGGELAAYGDQLFTDFATLTR